MPYGGPQTLPAARSVGPFSTSGRGLGAGKGLPQAEALQREREAQRLCPCVCAQLEVSQLEGSLQQPKALSALSPYLVPDTQALCQHLALIKHLATSGRFIIIIPRTGKGVPPCALPAPGPPSSPAALGGSP